MTASVLPFLFILHKIHHSHHAIYTLITGGFLLINFALSSHLFFYFFSVDERGRKMSFEEKPEKPRVLPPNNCWTNVNKYPRKKKERNKQNKKKNLGSVPDWHGINVHIYIYIYESTTGSSDRPGCNVTAYILHGARLLTSSSLMQPRRRLVPFSFLRSRLRACCVYNFFIFLSLWNYYSFTACFSFGNICLFVISRLSLQFFFSPYHIFPPPFYPFPFLVFEARLWSFYLLLSIRHHCMNRIDYLQVNSKAKKALAGLPVNHKLIVIPIVPTISIGTRKEPTAFFVGWLFQLNY